MHTAACCKVMTCAGIKEHAGNASGRRKLNKLILIKLGKKRENIVVPKQEACRQDSRKSFLKGCQKVFIFVKFSEKCKNNQTCCHFRTAPPIFILDLLETELY